MVGETALKRYALEEVLSEGEVEAVLKKVYNEVCEVEASEVRAAAAGLSGYLGEHLRVRLTVRAPQRRHQLQLFVKRLPAHNRPKAEFINNNHFFKRESLMFHIIDEMNAADEPEPWCARAYLHSGSLVVMPDLAAAGYALRPLLEPLDRRHALLAAAALARFHAAFADYHTQQEARSARPYRFHELYAHILDEPTFCASPWLRASAKLSADLLDEFSTKYTKKIPNLEAKLAEKYLEACDSLQVDESTLNVILHKDLWVNNIMFRYEDSQPMSALLIDYQCLRYGPPAFDLMSFLYLNTSRGFRDQHEGEVIKYYYETFMGCVSDETRRRLCELGYEEGVLRARCERGRMFGLFEAVGIFPQVLMDGGAAAAVFDDPATFLTVTCHDRAAPVLRYARGSPLYAARQIEVTEEFIERYLLPALQ